MNRAYKHCVSEADKRLLVTVMMFYESYKAVGIFLEPTTEYLDKLEEIMASCDNSALVLTATGVAAFLGCVIRENVGGKWTLTENGKYKIIELGTNKISIDLTDDLCIPLMSEKRSFVRDLYCNIEKKIYSH